MKKGHSKVSLSYWVRRVGFFNSAAYGWLTWRAPELSADSRYRRPSVAAAVDLGSGFLDLDREIGDLAFLGSGSASGPGSHDSILLELDRFWHPEISSNITLEIFR